MVLLMMVVLIAGVMVLVAPTAAASAGTAGAVVIVPGKGRKCSWFKVELRRLSGAGGILLLLLLLLRVAAADGRLLQVRLLLLLLLMLLLLNVAQVLEDLFCVLLVGIVGTAEEIRQLGGCETSGLGTIQTTIHYTIQFVVTVRIERAVREETAVVIENAQFGETRRGVVHETAAVDLAETIWRRLLLTSRRSSNGRGGRIDSMFRTAKQRRRYHRISTAGACGDGSRGRRY